MGNETSPSGRRDLKLLAGLSLLAAVVMAVLYAVTDGAAGLLYGAVALALVALMLYISSRRAVPAD